MVSWTTIKSTSLFLAPFLLPKILAYYQQHQQRSRRNRNKKKNNDNDNNKRNQSVPLQPGTRAVLLLLFLSGFLALLSSTTTTTTTLFPFLTRAGSVGGWAAGEQNIFWLTKSTLFTPSSVLRTRLRSLGTSLEKNQNAVFMERLLLQRNGIFDQAGVKARLLYARYGGEILVHFPWDDNDNNNNNNNNGNGNGFADGGGDLERDVFIYAFPALLIPHLVHLGILGIATSGLLLNRNVSNGVVVVAKGWRTLAVILGVSLAVAEVFLIGRYDDTRNQRSVRVEEVDFLFWRLKVWRGVAFAVVDGVVGAGMWAQGTGRAFVSAASTSERMLEHVQRLEAVVLKVRGVGIVRNGSVRDAALRRQGEDYWLKESEIMKDVMEQPEVLEAQRNALQRVDAVGIARDAEQFLDNVLGMPGVQATM